MKRALTCVALAGLAFPLAATAQSVLSIKQGSFTESLLSTTPVSGGVRVGILAGALESIVDPGMLSVRLPSKKFRTLCVDILSRDARYQAHLEYDISQASPGVYRLQFPSTHAGSLREYRARELAVLAHLQNDDCRARIVGIVVASWGSVSQPGVMTLLANTGGTDTRVSIPRKDGQRKMFVCSNISGLEKRTAYDTECRLSVDAESDLSRAAIVRQHFENYLEPVALPILAQ